MDIIILLYLLILSVEDIWKKELPIWQLSIGLVVAVIMKIIQWNGSIQETGAFFASLIPAALLLFAAWISREQIGYGDGLLMLPLGVLLGIQRAMGMMLCALLLAAVYALFLAVFARKSRHVMIPFVPFLLAGYMLTGGIV